MKAHCERRYDDIYETSEVQEERIRDQWRRVDSLAAWSGRKVEITASVLRARENDEEQGERHE